MLEQNDLLEERIREIEGEIESLEKREDAIEAEIKDLRSQLEEIQNQDQEVTQPEPTPDTFSVMLEQKQGEFADALRANGGLDNDLVAELAEEYGITDAAYLARLENNLSDIEAQLTQEGVLQSPALDETPRYAGEIHHRSAANPGIEGAPALTKNFTMAANDPAPEEDKPQPEPKPLDELNLEKEPELKQIATPQTPSGMGNVA